MECIFNLMNLIPFACFFLFC